MTSYARQRYLDQIIYKRFDFYGIGARSVRTNIGKEMDKAVTKALAAAK